MGGHAGCTLLLQSRTMSDSQELRIEVPESGGVSALLLRPQDARWLIALAHGAGAGMRQPFLQKLAEELAAVGIATLRYQFPYMESRMGVRRRAPDPPTTLTATVEAAVRTATAVAPHLPLLAGGKSMGGRMTSQAAAQGLLSEVRGLVFFGFPLHPPNKPGTSRAEHLAKVSMPMLFLQGTRDTLADLKLLRPVCAKLGKSATLHIIDSADHSFHVLKRSGKDDAAVLRELAERTSSWAEGLGQA